MSKLKAQSSQVNSSRKALKIPKPFIPCKYCGFNDHHSDECEYYPGCDICGSIAHEPSNCDKRAIPNNKKPGIARQQSNEPTEKSQVLKWYLGDNSSRDTKGYGSVNCNGITFTMVAYVNGLKHNLISISRLCDVNFKVLFTKTQGTIFNQNNEVVLIDPIRNVYVIDMLSYNKESNACFFAKASYKFKYHKLEEFCDEKGTSQNFSSPCTPEQNGVAERRNKTLIEAARTMSIIVKRHRKIAYDVSRGRSPNISYFHVLGCLVFIHNHMDHLGKFDKKADDGLFLRYSSVAKAFRVFNIRSDSPDLLVDDHPIHNEQDVCEPAETQEDSEAASAHECLYVNFLSEIELKRVIEALEEEGWVIAMQEAYSNSDYEGCNLDMKITSRGCQILRGKLVCWSTKKQNSVAMSSVKVEDVVDAECCAQVLWIKSQQEMASESSSQTTKTHVTPTSNVSFECDKSIIAFNNEIALLEHKNPLYQPMLKFLSNCCISTALTKQPSVYYSEYLKEFWYSVEVDAATNTITFTLSCFKKPLYFYLNDFSFITGLKYSENYESLPPKETVRAGLATLRLVDEKIHNLHPLISSTHLR
ncbi:retrovirus-related pol polyprotein from transposon TNT 1-94 [Tanacetum coccineum]